MKSVFKSVPTSLVLGMLTSAGVALSLIGLPATAQTTLDPLSQDGFQGETSDPFSERGSNQMNGMFELIHRATLGSYQGQLEFNQQQQRSIGDAAADFRDRQRAAMEQNAPQPGSQPSIVAPVYVPAPNN